MTVVKKLEFPDNKFDLYFLGYDSPQALSHGNSTFDREGLIELTFVFLIFSGLARTPPHPPTAWPFPHHGPNRRAGTTTAPRTILNTRSTMATLNRTAVLGTPASAWTTSRLPARGSRMPDTSSRRSSLTAKCATSPLLWTPTDIVSVSSQFRCARRHR